MSDRVIGIDLGTSHCALAHAELNTTPAPALMKIPQTVAVGEVGEHGLLPSFLYLPNANELTGGALSLPWNGTPIHAVGTLARELGAKTPSRLVSSAKSWLCHPGVDREEALLPLDAPDDVKKLSPVDASVAYLSHLREAFDHANDTPLREQDVVLTVPASFDPAARELTVSAAKRAGIENLTLLEEPQAALYAWIAATEGAYRDVLEVGDIILVIDVGGGTTDLSLIAVSENEETKEMTFERIAVGDHILLGGDNMDLALAHVVRQVIKKEQKKKLDAWQMRALALACRAAKETLLSTDAESVPIVVASRGSKLIGGSIRAELTRAQVTATLVDGFFPQAEASDAPVQRARSALTQFGLPYAQDPGVTRHIAAFLTKQRDAADDVEGYETNEEDTFLQPTALLLNGGVFNAPILVERLKKVIDSWIEDEGGEPTRLLDFADLDHAVARGAAFYGATRASGGLKITGGIAQSFYVGVETVALAVPGIEPELHALCLAPFGLEEGSVPTPTKAELGLVVGEPVRFRFFASSTRRDDEVGETLEEWEEDELIELGAIEATLPVGSFEEGNVVPVRLRARVTEVGTLLLEAIPRTGEDVWKVELNVREPTPNESPD